MKKLLCVVLSFLLIGCSVGMAACDKEDKNNAGYEMSGQEWDAAFSEEAFSNVSVVMTLGEGQEQTEQICKIVITQQKSMVELSVIQDDNNWTEIYVEENGKNVLYTSEWGGWSETEPQKTVEEILSIFDVFASLKFEDAEYNETDKAFHLTDAGILVSVKFDDQGMVESVTLSSGTVYRFSDYGKTTILIPSISDITKDVFESAVRATDYTLISEIKYADEDKVYKATLWRQNNLYRMNIPYRIITDEQTSEYITDDYFKEEADGIYIYKSANQNVAEDETWEKLSESDYNLFLINKNAATIGEINTDFFPLYDYIPQLTYDYFMVKGNLLTATDGLLAYFNGMSAYTNIQLNALVVEFRGNSIYQIRAEALYGGKAVSMKYTFSAVGTTEVNLPNK